MGWLEGKNRILNKLRQLSQSIKGGFKHIFSENWRHQISAYKELLKRYKEIFAFWWEHRNQIELPDLKAHEAEFLPSALALQAKPISPAGRWVAKLLIALMLAVFLWSLIGKMDIIVSGQGKIIAGGYTKAIASVEVAKVVGLYVQEGQTVKAGDLLIELDGRMSDGEQKKAQGDRQLALLQMERSKALLQSLTTNATPSLPSIDDVDQAHYQNEVKHLQDSWSDYLAKKARISSQIKRFKDSLPLLARRARDYRELAKEHDVSEHAYLEKEQARIDMQGQLDDAVRQLAALTAETRKAAQEDLYQATRIWSGAVQDVYKAAARGDQLRLVAPVDGVVQQLTVHTIGGVVPAAQTLMLIVPSNQDIELEAYVENKDIGFMHEGQIAHVKVDAYEYSKYGTIPAVVTHISRDAVESLNGGLSGPTIKSQESQSSANKTPMYSIKVTLQKSSILVGDKEMRLSPGMSGSVDIKTGERRIIEYVISPLITHARESLRER